MNNNEIPLQPDDVRRAQLVAAAETLATWVHHRRATWPGVSVKADREPLPKAQPVQPAPASAPFHWELPDPPGEEDYADALSELAGSSSAGLDHSPEPEITDERQSAFAVPLAAARSLGAPLRRLGSLTGQLGAGLARLGSVAANAGTVAANAGTVAAKAGAVLAIIAMLAAAGWAARPYLTKIINTATTGTAVFESTPPSEVLVDGVSIGTAPLTAEIAAGHHVIQFRRSRGVRTVEIDVATGRSTTARLDWDAPQMGQLIVRSDPAGARVLVDGKDRGVTPLTLEDVPLGSHAVVLQSDQGSVRRTVTVTADRAAAVTESIFAGWFKVFAPFDLQVTEGPRSIRLDDQNQAMLPPGVHELRFENSALGYSDVRRVEVQPGQTTSLSVVPPPSTLTVMTNMPAVVLVDGQQVGETPLTNHPIALGTRDIIVRNAAGEERPFTRTVTVAAVSIDVNF